MTVNTGDRIYGKFCKHVMLEFRHYNNFDGHF